MKKYRYIVSVFFLILLFVSVLGIKKATVKLTYLEFNTVNSADDTCTELSQTGDEIIQKFVMPYDILYGISVQVGTFERDNNSNWVFSLVDKESDKIIYKDTFNASLLEDSEYYLIELDRNTRLKKEKEYEFHIYAEQVTKDTSLSFYHSDNSTVENEKFYMNGVKQNGELCFKIYGGDFDFWWIKFVTLLGAAAITLVVRSWMLLNRGKRPVDDTLFMSIVVAFISFSILYFYAASGNVFGDENDNISGGMIIANGGVLYRDYITQHTPVTYYLCAVFALLGAGSVEQFRLSYYILTAIIWGLLYARHSKHFGKKKIFLLPIIESIFVGVIVFPQGFQVLSDGVQGICTVILLMEFLQYYRDKTITWDRVTIVSICVWGSIGAAFISVYAIVWVVIAVIIIEIMLWTKKEIGIGIGIKRYLKLFIAILAPPICAIIYFGVNHSLKEAFDQAYLFNREVYPKYYSIGNNVIQPFIDSVRNYFLVLTDNLIAIISNAAITNIVKFSVMLFTTVTLLYLIMKKEIIVAVTLFMTMICSATRGYGFHSIPAWYVAIMITVLCSSKRNRNIPEYWKISMVTLSIILMCKYIDTIGEYIFCKQTSITELESAIVEITSEGEGIFVDAGEVNDGIYLLYKNRHVVNKALYILPWYMDWYEQDTINDIQAEQPNIVIYCSDSEYANALTSEIKRNYINFSNNPDDGWTYFVWIKRQ